MKRLSLLLLVSFVATLGAAQTVNLRLIPKQGKTYVYNATTDQTQTGPGGTAMTKQTMSSSYKVVSVNATSTRFNGLISNVKVSGANAAQVQKSLSAMGNVGFVGIYDRRGRAMSLTPTTSSAAGKAMVNALSSMGAGFLGVEFAPGAVKIGSRWNSKIDVSKMLGQLAPGLKTNASSIPVTYVLQSLKGNRAQIGYTINGTMAFTMKQNNMPIKMKTVSTGTVVVDTSTGMPITNYASGRNDIAYGTLRMTQTMKISMKLAGSP